MRLHKYLHFLKVFDCLGVQIKIYHKQNDTLKSEWGGFFTVCLGLTVLVFAI